MRHGTSNRRQRSNRNNGQRRSNQGRSQVFDSNGPDVRIRGTAHQVAEKYMALAKDSAASGDVIMAESYLQHAEHYQRVINSWGDDVQGARHNQNQGEAQRQVDGNSAAQEDDLALPISILGVKSEAESKERVAEQV